MDVARSVGLVLPLSCTRTVPYRTVVFLSHAHKYEYLFAHSMMRLYKYLYAVSVNTVCVVSEFEVCPVTQYVGIYCTYVLIGSSSWNRYCTVPDAYVQYQLRTVPAAYVPAA